MNEDAITTATSRSAPSREELYELVWTTPLNKIAEGLDMTETELAKVCDTQKVPRPPLGHWSKVAVGREKLRPPLPEAPEASMSSWPAPKIAKSKAAKASRPPSTKRETAPPAERVRRPPLLNRVESLFLRTRNIEEYEFLRPYKQLLPDIVTSKESMARAIGLACLVYSNLEKRGDRVTFAPADSKMFCVAIDEREVPSKDRKYGRWSHGKIWSPQRPTMTYIDDFVIGIALTEMTERVTLRRMGDRYPCCRSGGLRPGSIADRHAPPMSAGSAWAARCQTWARQPRLEGNGKCHHSIVLWRCIAKRRKVTERQKDI